jgi:Holliday junction resolvase RusA-like endonuclease
VTSAGPDPETVRAITDPLNFGRYPRLEPLSTGNPFVTFGREVLPPTELRVFVPGTAMPKGSKTAKGRRRNGSAILVESADVAPWQSEVARAARRTGIRFAGPVTVELTFLRKRPKHPTYRDVPAGKPDGDKLERAVWDALTEAGTIEDDARVVQWSGRKRYAAPDQLPGVLIVVKEWTPDGSHP